MNPAAARRKKLQPIPFLMQQIYNLVGWLVFGRQQVWEQRKNGKILVLTVAFSLALGLVLAEALRMMSHHRK